MLEFKDFITIGIACIALSLSVTTLYFSQLRVARLQIAAGEYLHAGHFTQGNFNVSLAVTLVNHGAQTAIVQRVALVIRRPQNGESYLLEPIFFQSVDGAGNFVHESPAAPFGVSSKQSLTKQVLFRSSYPRPTEFQMIEPGVYEFTLLGWVGDKRNPVLSTSFSALFSEENVAELRTNLAQQLTATVSVSQAAWEDLTARKLTDQTFKWLTKSKS
jgi:hypothetical protein